LSAFTHTTGIGITSADLQTLINLILQIYNYFWAIVGALLVDRTGRRFLFLTSIGGMCVAFICWTICSAVYSNSSTVFDAACLAENAGDKTKCVALNANKHAGNAVIAFIFLFYGFYDIAMTPLVVAYPVEILPYGLRSKGLMVMQFSVSASLIFNQYVNPIALAAIQWKYYIVFCVFLAFEFIYCYFFVLETRGADGPLPLEEIAALFDGPGYYGFQRRPGIVRSSADEEHVDSSYSSNKDAKEDMAQFDEVARDAQELGEVDGVHKM
jgi:MFS family permease